MKVRCTSKTMEMSKDAPNAERSYSVEFSNAEVGLKTLDQSVFLRLRNLPEQDALPFNPGIVYEMALSPI